MAIDIVGVLDAVTSHALKLGVFERVNGHELKSAPPTGGLTCEIWADRIAPVRGSSGLAATSVLLILNVRVRTGMTAEPQDGIDPAVITAVDALLEAYSGDFELGGAVREVDLLGAQGTPLGGRAGYLTQDGKIYRVFVIDLPVIVSDAWVQAG